jgi:hypothetical protein
MLACLRCRGADTHVLAFSSLSRDSRLGMAIRVRISSHPRVSARWVRVQFYTRGLHPHTTRTETGSNAGLVLHPRVTEKSPTVFFTCHPNGADQLGAHLNAQAHVAQHILTLAAQSPSPVPIPFINPQFLSNLHSRGGSRSSIEV